MVEAYHKDIIFPNKQVERDHIFTNDGHLIDSETYVGAKVEALESGVFRSDIPVKFRLDVERLELLKEHVSEAMRHTLIAEMDVKVEDIVDFDTVCEQVEVGIDELIKNPVRHENPKIYHLDVGAMWVFVVEWKVKLEDKQGAELVILKESLTTLKLKNAVSSLVTHLYRV